MTSKFSCVYQENDNTLNLVLKTRELRDGEQTMYQLVHTLLQHGADIHQKDLVNTDINTGSMDPTPSRPHFTVVVTRLKMVLNANIFEEL